MKFLRIPRLFFRFFFQLFRTERIMLSYALNYMFMIVIVGVALLFCLSSSSRKKEDKNKTGVNKNGRLCLQIL